MRTTDEIFEALTSTIIGILAFFLFWALLTGCGGRTPMEVRVAPELDESQVREEVHRGVAFYCEVRNLDYFHFTDNLTIEVLSEDQWYSTNHGWVQGMHYPTLDRIAISWLEGVHANALFHELLHREASRRRGAYHDTSGEKEGKMVDHRKHPLEFYEVWAPIISAWRKEVGAQ